MGKQDLVSDYLLHTVKVKTNRNKNIWKQIIYTCLIFIICKIENKHPPPKKNPQPTKQLNKQANKQKQQQTQCVGHVIVYIVRKMVLYLKYHLDVSVNE